MLQHSALMVSQNENGLPDLQAACTRVGMPVHRVTDAAPLSLEQLRRDGLCRLFFAGRQGALWRGMQTAHAADFDTFWVEDAEPLADQTAAPGHTTRVAQVVQACHHAERLRAAEAHAMALLQRLEQARIVRPGRSESAMARDILALAGMHAPAVDKFWHKRIVRVGRNTVETFQATPPDTQLGEDDIAFVDLGPVLQDFEADLGRAYAFGDDPEKARMVADTAEIFAQCQQAYWQRPHMTGAQLYATVVRACEARGWRFGHVHCGHLVGPFPHALRLKRNAWDMIAAHNDVSMSAPAADGEIRHWILEIHLVHPQRRFGAFYEQLL